MIVEQLALHNFRNFETLTLEPGPRLNVFVGENAQGKTNLLEAIYLLGTTKSFRASRESEAIRVGCRQALTSAVVRRSDGLETEVQVLLEEGERKTALINHARAARAIDLIGILQVVFFGALDLRLVNGEPSVRRRYMDLAISQTTPAYCTELIHYRRVLLHRGNLLRRLRDGWVSDGGLEAWNLQLATYGARIIARRLGFAGELQSLAAAAHADLSGNTEELSVRYLPSPRVEGVSHPDGIVPVFLEALHRTAEEEIRRGATLTGPQRDDLRFRIHGMDARVFASQGQQRTVVLSLKLAELAYLHAHTGEQPVLLLDDVMSDLDDQRRARLLSRVQDSGQVFITCTGLRGFPEHMLANARIFSVSAGRVHPHGE